MVHILIINGSYRSGGISSQVIAIVQKTLEAHYHQVELIHLKEHRIEYCLNCRSCTQKEGSEPSSCVIDDDMSSIITKIEEAHGYVLISPTNFYSVTALYKSFLERLTPYGYWTWGMSAPKDRKENKDKKAIIISSCAAPSLLGHIAYNTLKLLKITAQTIGAKVVDSLMIGLISQKEHHVLSDKDSKRVKKVAFKLNRALESL